jgi:hypothetical protein
MNQRVIMMWSVLLLMASIAVGQGATKDDAGKAQQKSTNIMNELLEAYDPCAGSPVPAVCRCALEFPPVTFDETVPFKLLETGNEYDLATGQTLMSFVRAIVVAAEPEKSKDDEMAVELYVNPPATPNAMSTLKKVVGQNRNFRQAELVACMYLPRHLGGNPDRLFGGIWWVAETKTLLIAFRGTQTPFEWHLDGMVNSHRTIRDGLEVSNGFGAGYEYCRDQIQKIIEQLKPKSIFVTGHSLGAAIASIAGTDLYMQMADKKDAPFVRVMTFGQPRTFAPGTADRIDASLAKGDFVLWRVINDSDPIPDVPNAAVTGDGVKFQHTDWVAAYADDPSAGQGRGAAWNHHYYYDGYFDPNPPLVRGPTRK